LLIDLEKAETPSDRWIPPQIEIITVAKFSTRGFVGSASQDWVKRSLKQGTRLD